MFDPTLNVRCRKARSHAAPSRAALAPRKGAIVPLFLVLLPVLLILCGFAINLAYMQLVSTELKVATDAAALNRNTAGIAVYLGETFEKTIEFAHKRWMAKVRLDKDKYLALIDEGWAGIGDYDYQRDDIEIHIMPDGLSGLSYSTVTENMVQDGVKMTSRVREHATYALENGRPVITRVGGHTLLGDTTPH